jgi:large subunit ribosomal protein L13
MKSTKTTTPNQSEIKRNWYIVDAKDKILGKVAAKVAIYLQGKNKADYTPYIDMGDEVIVINAQKVATTGKKLKDKMYKRYSGYPGGLKETSLEVMLEKKPEEVISHAVKGMLPKNKLGSKMMTRLKVYKDAEHPHQAQNPVVLDV